MGDASTRWTVILGAAEGRPLARDEFAQRYAAVIRAYLRIRWAGSAHAAETDDAAQEVFVECFKEGGALSRADPERGGGFRAFLFGVVRNVARRFEQTRRAPQIPSEVDVPDRADTASRAFDRAWAESIMRQATQLQAERAHAGGAATQRRFELLRLRFEEGLPVREIAARWGLKPPQVQYEYKRAREEFEAALVDVVRRHDPRGDAAAECARLVSLLA